MPITLNQPALGLVPIDLTSPDTKGTKIHAAAQQFEALLIGEMLKSAREGQSGGWLGSGEDTGDETGIEMAESQFSTALAKSGGLGLAKMIEGAMAKANREPAQKTAETPQTDSGVSSENRL